MVASSINPWPQEMTVTKGFLFTEAGADVYTARVRVPAYAVIQDIKIYAQAVWDAATSAVLDVGDFTTAATPVAIDADGFFAAIDLKATDLLAGQALSIWAPASNADVAQAAADTGAYVDTTAVHVLQLMDEVDRWITAVITSVGAGTLGRTAFYVTYSAPVMTDVVGAAAALAA